MEVCRLFHQPKASTPHSPNLEKIIELHLPGTIASNNTKWETSPVPRAPWPGTRHARHVRSIIRHRHSGLELGWTDQNCILEICSNQTHKQHQHCNAVIWRLNGRRRLTYDTCMQVLTFTSKEKISTLPVELPNPWWPYSPSPCSQGLDSSTGVLRFFLLRQISGLVYIVTGLKHSWQHVIPGVPLESLDV